LAEVSTINLLFEVNFAAFAIFASLLITEIMASVLMLLYWKETKASALEYIVPIWEVTGTFGAFWVVTSYFAYPSLLVTVANIFAPLLIVFLILFVARNASISFGEFITKRGWWDEERLYKMYSLATLLLGIVVLILLSSLVSGKGISLSAETFSLGGWISSPGSLLFVVGALAIGVGLAPVFYSISSMRRITFPITLLGIFLSTLSYYLFSPSLISSWILVPVLLPLVVALLFFLDKANEVLSNKAVFIGVLSISVFSLQFLVYPSALGRSLVIDKVTTSGATASAFTLITMVGGTLLAVMLAFYIAIVARAGHELRVAKAA
jgi:cytochrome d ubiquinol oxidase subunit II